MPFQNTACLFTAVPLLIQVLDLSVSALSPACSLSVVLDLSALNFRAAIPQSTGRW